MLSRRRLRAFAERQRHYHSSRFASTAFNASLRSCRRRADKRRFYCAGAARFAARGRGIRLFRYCRRCAPTIISRRERSLRQLLARRSRRARYAFRSPGEIRRHDFAAISHGKRRFMSMMPPPISLYLLTSSISTIARAGHAYAGARAPKTAANIISQASISPRLVHRHALLARRVATHAKSGPRYRQMGCLYRFPASPPSMVAYIRADCLAFATACCKMALPVAAPAAHTAHGWRLKQPRLVTFVMGRPRRRQQFTRYRRRFPKVTKFEPDA